MADSKRVELYKQRQLIEEQLEKCKEEREHARRRREREKQARKLREEAFDMKLQWTMDRQLRRKTKSSDSVGDSHSNNDDDSSDDNPLVSRLARNQELNHPVLPQQPRNGRRSKREDRSVIGEETGQKEQPISDGSDFVSGYSDDSDHMSQGDDNGLVAEVQSLRQQLAAVNTERNQLISAAQELPTVTLDGRQLASNLPRYRQPFPRSLSTQSTKSEAIQNLFVEIDRLGQESNHLKQQLHCKAVECDELLQLLEDKDAALLAAQVENKELQSDLLRLENDNLLLSRGQTSSGNYSSSLWNKKVINELESKLSVLQQQLDHVIKERDQFNKEKNHLAKEKDRLIRDFDRVNKEKHQIINERDKLSKERDHVISQRDLMVRGKDQMIKEKDQVILERDQVIKDKDQAVSERNQLAKERDHMIIEMDHVIKNREEVVIERDQLVKERDQVIMERDQVIMERDQVIIERDRVATEKDQVISNIDQLLRDMRLVTKERDQVTEEKDKVIRENYEVAEERDQVISERNQAIRDRDHIISERDGLVREKDKAVREKDQILKERDEIILVRKDLDEKVVNLRQRLDHVMQENISFEAKLKVANQSNDAISDQLVKAQHKLDHELKQSREKLDHVMQRRDHVMQKMDHVLTSDLSQLLVDLTKVKQLVLDFNKTVLSRVTRMHQEVISQYRVQIDDLKRNYLSKEQKLIDVHDQEVSRLTQLADSRRLELQQARREDLLQMERAELNSFEASMWRRQCRKQSIQLCKMNARWLQAVEQHKQQMVHYQSSAEVLANTKEQLELANKQLVTKGQQLESMKQELVNQQMQLESAKKELSDVYQVSIRRNEELLELKKRVFCSEQDKLQLVSELSSLRVSRGSNMKLLEAQVQHLVSERDSLKAQLTSLKEQSNSRAVAIVSPCGNHSEALQEKIVQLQGRVEARDEVLEELQREMKEKELANFSVVAKLKGNNIELSGQLEAAKANIVAKESRLREVEDRLSIVEQQLTTTATDGGSSEVVRLRSLVTELTFKLSQAQHCCSYRSNISQPSVTAAQLPSGHDELFASRRPKYTLLPRQPTTGWARNSLLRSQFSINLPGQSDQSIDLLDNSSSDQYSLGPVVVTDDEHTHSQLEHVKHRYRTHRRVQSCDSSLSACLPSPNSTSSQHVTMEMSQSSDVANKARPKSAESSHHHQQQPMKSPLGSCDLPVTPLVTTEGRGSATPLVTTPVVVTSEVGQSTVAAASTMTAAATVITTSATSTATANSEQRKFKLLKKIIGFRPAGESNKGKRTLGPVITISVPTAATICGEKDWGVKRSESITSNDTSFTTGSISPSLDGCENFSKIERHESFASYGGVSRTSSIVSRDFLLATPKVSSCFKPIAPDEESSSEEDWDKPYLFTANQQDLLTLKRKNQSMIDMATAAAGLPNDISKTGGMQFSIRLLPQQRSYSSDTINLDTMEASESEEEHERLRNVNELMRRKGRLHCRYSSTGSLVKIYGASDTSMEDIRSLQQ